MPAWIPPTFGYVVILGAGGVTAKLALRTISWEQLVLWVPVAYIFFSLLLVVFKGTTFPLGVGGGWAAATALAASSSLVLLFYALTKGPASQVVPGTSAYPVVTLVGSALFLSEKITVVRGLGTALVVAGVVLLSR
jgi:bacterial/archaeal transporter family protein